MESKTSSFTIQDVREASRRYSARVNQEIYSNTINAIGNELEYSSARHFVAGLAGLMSDSVHTLWNPIEKMIKSPYVKELLEEKLGKGVDPLDYLRTANLQGKTGAEREKAHQELEDSLNTLKKAKEYPQNILDYCNSTGKTPDEVLNSPRERLTLLEKTYGSLEEYESFTKKALSRVSEGTKVIQQMENAPIGLLTTMLIMQGAGSKSLEVYKVLTEAGIDPMELGDIAQSYVKDIAKFTKAYIAEGEKYQNSQMEEYRRIKAEEQKPLA